MSARLLRSRLLRSRLLRALALGCAALVVSGCAGLPTESPVKVGRAGDQGNQDVPFDFNPGGPKPGSSPVEIVSGFLTAMQATPLTTAVARRYLTAESSSRWVPEKGTVVFGNEALSQTGSTVTLQLHDTVALDGRGEWQGDPTGGKGLRYDLKLVREKGQWRISRPPDTMIVPQSHFEARFQQFNLYFFDKSAQVLVPEPVYLPRGDQAPTLLVAGLLRGPAQNLLGVERTFIPARTRYDLSVPVGRDGTADVPLSDDILDLSPKDLKLALAQLAWTLQQIKGVDRLRVTVDGSPLELPGGGADQNVDAFSEFDPAVNWASNELFGIRRGRVVTLVGDTVRPVTGVFGQRDFGLRSIALDLPAQRVAGVSGDGTQVLVAPRSAPAGTAAGAAGAKTVYSGGSDVLRPGWDLYGQLWFVDRGPRGAALSIVGNSGARTVTAPGITGEAVSAFVVSRDGTRIVAVLDGKTGDRLVVARVLRGHSGAVRALAPAAPLPTGADPTQIRDVAWSTPGSVAVLAGRTAGASQVLIARVDGSSTPGTAAAEADLFREQAVRLVTSPSLGSPVYAGTSTGQLFELTADGRWTGTGISSELRSPTFVG